MVRSTAIFRQRMRSRRKPRSGPSTIAFAISTARTPRSSCDDISRRSTGTILRRVARRRRWSQKFHGNQSSHKRLSAAGSTASSPQRARASKPVARSMIMTVLFSCSPRWSADLPCRGPFGMLMSQPRPTFCERSAISSVTFCQCPPNAPENSVTDDAPVTGPSPWNPREAPPDHRSCAAESARAGRVYPTRSWKIGYPPQFHPMGPGSIGTSRAAGLWIDHRRRDPLQVLRVVSPVAGNGNRFHRRP
jgi:hypothetical protein